jgi:hypothetical protein
MVRNAATMEKEPGVRRERTLKRHARRPKSDVQMATHCKIAGECSVAAGCKTPANAPVVPVMLNSLPPKKADKLPAQNAVRMPATGVPPHAIDRAIERGMFTNATVMLLRRLFGTSERPHRTHRTTRCMVVFVGSCTPSTSPLIDSYTGALLILATKRKVGRLESYGRASPTYHGCTDRATPSATATLATALQHCGDRG